MNEINISINEEFKFLYTDELDKYREIFFYGGRGGAKTYEMVQFLTLQALKEQMNILCLREFATRTKASIVEEFRRFILEHELNEKLQIIFTERTEKAKNKGQVIEIKINEIHFKNNGSKIIFSGINDNTAMSLKSYSNIKYCWLEECNDLSETAHRIIKPTIRANNSKLFYTFNPQNKDDYVYQLVKENVNPRTFIKKVNYDTNAFFPQELDLDRLADLKFKPREIYNHIWLGEPLNYNDMQMIDTDKIGYFDDNNVYRYDEIIISCDTASSIKENADFTAIGIFGLKGDEIHLIKMQKLKVLYDELVEKIKQAYNFVFDIYKINPTRILIEKKSSGVSVVEHLQRDTSLPITPVIPKTDKVARVSLVLTEFSRLKLPMNKNNILNFWVADYLDELKSFRGDMQHAHDDMLDSTTQALQYFKENKPIDWSIFY